MESHYRPKKDVTILMEKPEDLDDDENDEKCDERPMKKQLSGLVVLYMESQKGEMKIKY